MKEEEKRKREEVVNVGATEGRGREEGQSWLYDDMLLCSALLRKTP